MSRSVPPPPDDRTEAFLRSIVPPEEERRRYTSAPAAGFRWFESPNILDLVRIRLGRTRSTDHA